MVSLCKKYEMPGRCKVSIVYRGWMVFLCFSRRPAGLLYTHFFYLNAGRSAVWDSSLEEPVQMECMQRSCYNLSRLVVFFKWDTKIYKDCIF